MPLYPLFTSHPPKREYSKADRAECERLAKTPFEQGEYRRIKRLIMSHVQVSGGEFLYVKHIDQKRNQKGYARHRANAKKYLGGNVIMNGAFTALDQNHVRHF